MFDVQPAIATAALQTYAEGAHVPLSVDLNDQLRVIGSVTTTPSTSTAVVSAQIAVTGVAAALSNVACKELLIQADLDNGPDIVIGGAAAQAYRLSPGANTGWMSVDNWNRFYAMKLAGAGAANLNVLSRS